MIIQTNDLPAIEIDKRIQKSVLYILEITRYS